MAPLGETVKYQFRKLFGYRFIKMQINFDPILHIEFVRTYIQAVPGIGVILSIDKRGYLIYSLIENYDQQTIVAGITKEFNHYFSTLDKSQL
jgi:hypothetical protein